MNGFFAGIVIPFYEGRYLYHLKDFTFSEKYSAAKQMVRNGKELHQHFIYPDDYKLDNMILDPNGVVKFFDLDDVFTKVWIVPSFYLNMECNFGLFETIQAFFDEDASRPYHLDVRKALKREYEPLSFHYSKMLDYIERKNKDHSFVIASQDSDISKLQEFLSSHPYSLLYRIPVNSPSDDDSYYFQIIQRFKELGIPIYDFLKPYDLIDVYSNNFRTVDSVELKGKEFVKCKK